MILIMPINLISILLLSQWIPDLEIEYNLKKECIPVGCVPPARYRLTEILLDRDPPDRDPLDRDPPVM